MKPKAIIFDFFGVICANVGGDWFKKHAHDKEEALRDEYLHKADLGIISEEESFNAIAQTVGEQGDTLRSLWLTNAVLNDDLIAVIKELKGRYKLAICTNAPHTFFNAVLEKEGIRELFDVIVCSSEVGYMKPDAKIFEIVLERLGVESSEAVFVDDTERNVRKAEELGMRGIVFQDASQVKELL